MCNSALEPRAEDPALQQGVTKALISRRVEDKHLRVKREQCVPSALRKWKLLMEGDKKKWLRVVPG